MKKNTRFARTLCALLVVIGLMASFMPVVSAQSGDSAEIDLLFFCEYSWLPLTPVTIGLYRNDVRVQTATADQFGVLHSILTGLQRGDRLAYRILEGPFDHMVSDDLVFIGTFYPNTRFRRDVRVDLPSEMSVLRFVIDNTTFTNRGTPNTLEAAPFLANGRTMVPLRVIIEALGATDIVFVDTPVRTVSFVLNNQTISMVIDQPLPNNMGTPVIIANRTFVPLRYVIDEMGADVLWDDKSRAAYVYIS